MVTHYLYANHIDACFPQKCAYDERETDRWMDRPVLYVDQTYVDSMHENTAERQN